MTLARPLSLAVSASIFAFLALLAGCDGRPSRVPVTGTVTYEGQPVKEGTVIFEVAGQRSANGKILDGKIVDVFTFEPGDGAIPGKAKVAVYATGAAPAAATSATPADPSATAPVSANYMSGGASLIPERYNNPATSGLEYEIKADGGNDLQIPLTK